MVKGLLKETNYHSTSLHKDIRLISHMIGAITSSESKDRAYPKFVYATTRINDLTPQQITRLYDELKELAPDTLQMLASKIRLSKTSVSTKEWAEIQSKKVFIPPLDGADNLTREIGETGKPDIFKFADMIGIKQDELVSYKDFIARGEQFTDADLAASRLR